MANYLEILINNDMGLAPDVDLYLYIIGEIKQEVDGKSVSNYYAYDVTAAGNYVATRQAANTVTAVKFSDLMKDPSKPGVSLFNFDQSEYFSGRIWFSTSADLITISSLQVNQPEPSGGMLFDFAELTINPNDNVNCDTTQVVGLGIPITIINPAKLAFPPVIKDAAAYTYPNAIGIVPGNSLASIINDFKSYTAAIGLDAFSVCAAAYSPPKEKTVVNWLINPGFQVPYYDSSKTPSGLETTLDDMIFEFFNFYSLKGNSLKITFKGMDYTGAVVTQAGLDSGNPTQKYCAFVFTDSNKVTYPIFYPYFSTNSASTQGGTLNPNGSLPPAPSFWSTKHLPSTMSASGQALLCEGAFNDGNPDVGNKTILAALQNIFVSMLNRGLIPGKTMNNLFPCTGQLTLDSAPVTFIDKDPSSASTFFGASLLYTPPQIPANTDPASCSISGSILLKGAASGGGDLTQKFSTIDGKIVVESASGTPKNASTSPVVVQLITGSKPAPDQLVQFSFNYQSAVLPDGTAPELVAPITVEYTPFVTSALTARFEGTDFSTDIQKGMDVFDLNVQNPASVIACDDHSLILKSSINGILPSPSQDTLLIGKFFPMIGTKAKGSWNAFAAFLHQGGNGVKAPYISNQGYAYAYDDDGGYSSDITVTFPENGNSTLGIYLGPLV